MRSGIWFPASVTILGLVLTFGNAYGALPDSDGDGDVDLRDIAAFTSCFGKDASTSSCVRFDSNTDGDVDLVDWRAVAGNFYGVFSPCPEDVAISPQADSGVPAALVGIYGRVPPGASKVLTNGASGFMQPDGTYLVPNVGLVRGDNTLRIDGLNATGDVICSRLLHVQRTGDAIPVVLRLSPTSGPPGTEVIARVESSMAIDELHIDFDSDGLFDTHNVGKEAKFVYKQSGRFAVFAAARSAAGHFFSNLLPTNGVASAVVVIGAQVETTASAAVVDPVDIALGITGQLAVLGGNSVVTVFDGPLNLVNALSLKGLTEPVAVGILEDGCMLVVDAGNHQVSKFRPDGSLDDDFGDEGTVGGEGGEVGDFASPNDVAADADGNIFIADTGNSRLVKLDGHGSWLKHVAANPPPRGLVVSGSNLYVVNGSQRIHLYNRSLEKRDEIVVSEAGVSSIFVGSELVATTNTGVAVRTLSGGFQADFPNTGVFTADVAVSIFDPGGPAIVAADRGRGALVRFVGAADIPGKSPLDAWYTFSALLESGRVAEAASLLTGEVEQTFLSAVDALNLQALLEWLRRYETFTLVFRSGTVAEYKVTVTGVPNALYVTFERVGLDGTWKIAAF